MSLPCPALAVGLNAAPCIGTIALLIASPNPNPPNCRLMDRSAARSVEQPGSASGSMRCVAAVAHFRNHMPQPVEAASHAIGAIVAQARVATAYHELPRNPLIYHEKLLDFVMVLQWSARPPTWRKSRNHRPRYDSCRGRSKFGTKRRRFKSSRPDFVTLTGQDLWS